MAVAFLRAVSIELEQTMQRDITSAASHQRSVRTPEESTTSDTTVSQARMDALIDGHYRAEEADDIDAIVEGFIPDAEHDVAGNPGGPLHGREQIGDFYRALLAELRIDRWETVRRWYGHRHAVDEAIVHGTAVGRPFGLDGRDRPIGVRVLHVFDFADGLISRENAWFDVLGLQAQLS
jgi:uncharacterized protein